jgi:hypothetical protein
LAFPGARYSQLVNNDESDFVLPPPPGNHNIGKSEPTPTDPQSSPYRKPGETPVWITCRATQECPGRHAVQMGAGEIALDNGGGNWIRYRCLTCGGGFHIRL